MENNLTVKSLKDQFGDNIYEAIDYAKTYTPKYPERLNKPYLPKSGTPAEYVEYAKKLEAYEKDKEEYDKKMKEYRNQNGKITNIIEDYIKDISGLNNIPEQYRSKVYYKAYQDGHSSGFYGVYQELIELVEIFE